MNIEEKKNWIKEHWTEIEAFVRGEIEDFGGKYYAYLDEEARQKEIAIMIEESFKEEKNQYKYEEANCKEEVFGINIHDYLEEFRYTMDKEKILYLIFDKGEIVDKMLIECGIYAVRECDMPKEKLIQYYQEGKQLYCCHNHPCRISAVPSVDDIINLAKKIPNYYYAKGAEAAIKRVPEKIKRAKENQPYEFFDWGIVTSCDYYSYQQIGDISEWALKINE